MRPFTLFFAVSLLGSFVLASETNAESSKELPPESKTQIFVAPPTRKPPAPNDINMAITGHTTTIPFTANDLATAYGFSQPPAKFRNEQYRLKASIVGTKKERKRTDKECESKDFSVSESAYGCAYVSLKKKMDSNAGETQPTKTKKKATAKAKSKAKANKPPQASALREQTDWENLEPFGYRALLPLLKVESLEEAKILVSYAQKAKCKTPATSAALIVQMESLLPNPDVWPLIDSAYAAVADCTPFDSIYHETLHQRMGFLNIWRKKSQSAKESLNRALLAAAPAEEFRTLFWRGFLENDLDNIPSQIKWNKFWDRLTIEYPLTQHAVLAHGIFGEHPIAKQLEQTPPRMTPFTGTEWNEPNLANFIYLNFVTQNDKKTAKEFASKIEGKITPQELGPAMFLAAAHRTGGNYRESMRVIYSAARLIGANAINPEIVRLLYPELYVKEVTQHAKNLEVPFVLSLMRQESSFNPHAESPRGARGLMQVLPSTAQGTQKKKMGPINLKDPNQNIAAGCTYLRQQIKRFQGSEIFTLAAYNAGPTVTARWLERYKGAAPLLWADLIPYPETRSYVSGILRGRFWYRYLLSGGSEKANSIQELAFAERILETRLSPNLASREAPSGILGFFARAPRISTGESEEPLYSEEF